VRLATGPQPPVIQSRTPAGGRFRFETQGPHRSRLTGKSNHLCAFLVT